MDKEVLKDLHDRAVSKGYTKSIEDFSVLLSSDEEVLNDNFNYVTEKGYTKSIEDFSVLVGVTQPQEEELTEEMMETGQRDAAPAYAMTEDKFEAEKKKDGVSPLQDGQLSSQEPQTDFTTYEQEIEVSAPLLTQEDESLIDPEFEEYDIEKSTQAEMEKNRLEDEKIKSERAMVAAVGREQGKIVSALTGNTDDAIMPNTDIAISEKIDEGIKKKKEETRDSGAKMMYGWRGEDNYYANLYLNYLDEINPNKANDLRSRIENDSEYFNKRRGDLKAPSSELVAQGFNIAMTVGHDNFEKAANKAESIIEEIEGLKPEMQIHQDRIKDGAYNGTEEQLSEYIALAKKADGLLSLPQIESMQKAEDDLERIKNDYKNSADVNILSYYEEVKRNNQITTDRAYRKNNAILDVVIPITDAITKGGIGTVASIADFANNLNMDNEWGLSDDVASYIRSVADTYEVYNPTPTKFAREMFEQVAVIDGYEVVLKGGKPTGQVFAPNGYLATEEDSDKYLTEYSANPDEYDTEESFNFRAGLYTSTAVGADMLMGLIPIGGGVSKIAKVAGMSTKVAGAVGVSTAVIVQSQNDFYQAAKEAGATDQEAAALGFVQAGVIALVALINPIEAKALMTITGASRKKLISQYVKEFASGVPRKTVIEKFGKAAVAKALVKKGKTVGWEMLKEGAEETLEIPSNAAVAKAWDYLGGVNTQTETDVHDVLNTFATAGLGSLPFALIGGSGGSSRSRQELMYAATTDLDATRALLRKSIGKEITTETGEKIVINDDYINKHIAQLEELKKVGSIYFSNKNITEEDKVSVTSLIADKKSLEEASKVGGDVVKNANKAKIEAIDEALGLYLNKEKGQPFYTVQGLAITKEQLEERMANPEWVKGFKAGRWSLKVSNDKETENKLATIYNSKDTSKAEEPVTEESVTEEKPTPRVFETPTDEKYAVVNEGKGEGDRVLTKTEYDEYVAPAEVTNEEVIDELTTRGLDATKENQKQVRFELEQRKKEAAPAEEVVSEKAPVVAEKETEVSKEGQAAAATKKFPNTKVKKIVYHGTDKSFDEFNTDDPMGVSFGSYEYAKEYIKGKKGGRIIAAYVDVRNPETEKGLPIYTSIKSLDKKEAIKKAGYDSVLSDEITGGLTEEVIVFNKEQIHVIPETEINTEQDAIQEPSTEAVDVQEPARDSREVGEGDVRETTEEVDTQDQSPEAEAQVKQEADDLADALGLDDDVKFQLETEMTDKKRKEKLEKEADDLMNEVQPENVETIENVEGVEPIPVNLEENVEPVERTGIKRFKLRDIIGKKLNLLMADKLKIELKDPSKPYNQETNPYVKMGGNFFPLMDKMFGKVAWASITDAATTKIIKGAMDGDLSAVYNMGDGGVDSNIAIPTSLDAALDKIFPADNKGNVNPKKDEIFQLIKARVLKSEAKEIKKAHKHFKNASTIMEAFKSLTDEEVKVRAAVMNWVVPTSLSNVSTSIDLYNKLSDLGISIETLRDENAEQFAKDLPDGAITMIVEVQDENGVPVRERKLQLDKDLADKKITKRQYEKAINDVIQSAKMTLEQQNQEGIPSHPNYPSYIRGKAIALMEETASFFKIIPEYRQKFNERVSGIDKKKTGNVKEGATEVEESVYNQIKEAKKDSTSKEAKKEIIEALLKGDVKKLKSGKVKTKTIALLKEALKLNNKAGIKEILAIAETPFAETTQYTAGGIRSADMTSGMTTSTTSYEIVEYLRDQHSRFLTRLSKSFPSVDVVLSQAEFDAIISDAQAKKLVLANQKVYGAVYEGKLYLNPNLPNYNTPIHEFGHVWLNVARELGKDTYKKGMALMTEDSPYYQQVINSKEYGKIIAKMRKDGVSEADIKTYIKEEALATAIGDKGESFTSAAANKNFKNWLNELFEFIGKLTGISELTPDQLQNINLDEFVQGVVVDIMSENEVFAGAEVKSFGEQLQLMTVPEDSMTKIIEFGRAENFSDASIKELLKKRGFKVADINNAMVVNIDIETQLPSEFNRVKGGVGEATQMFKDVRKKLSTFAKGKRKKLPAKKLTAAEKRAKANELRQLNPSLFEMSDDAILKKFPEPAQYEVTSAPTMSEVRAKAIELLKSNPVFQKQSAAVQGAILVGFDKTIGTRSNKKVQDVINNIKNKAKAMREGVKSIKEAQKELKAALKEMPMSQDIRRIIKAVGDVNQDNVLAQLERISELVDNIKSKEAVSDAQKRALQMKIDQLKKNAKALSSLKGDMRRFIRQSLPLSNMYSKAQLNKVAAIIDNINFDNQVEQVQKLFDLVDAQRSKMKKATVKRMLDKAKKYAKKKRTGKLVAKAGSVEAQGQAFFTEAAKILQLAYDNDTNGMLELSQELSDLDGIDEIVQKEINGEKLTQQEQALLDRVYAFDTLRDVMGMELEDVIELENAINDVKNESAVRLKDARLERSERYSRLSRESEVQIKKDFRELFTINGILKTANQLNKSSKAIYEEFKRNGTVAAVKKLIDDIGYSQYNPVSFVRNLLLHMGTMSTILDKGGKFFTDNIVTPLKDANENNLRGYQQQIQKLDELANAVKGIDGGFKQVMKMLRGKGMFVVGIETGTRADIDAIRAMVQQNPTDPKTLAKAKELISKAVKERMKYLTMSKSDIKAQMKAINETLDATTLIEEQVEYIDAISKLKQVDGMTLTKDQLLRIYALSKNDVQREKLKGQGFTNERMAEIEQFLGPELIAFADNTVDYLSGQYYESVNDVHVRVNDVNLDFIENYFPTRSLRDVKPKEYGADNFGQGFNQNSPSAISQRVDTKSGVDLTQTFAGALKNHLQQMERYKAYAETVNTIQKILAFPQVDALLERTGLKKMYYLTIDNEVNPSSESMPFFQWLANRFYGMTLGFKLIQIPKQATSFINAYEQYSFFKDGKKKMLGGLGPDLMGFAYDYAKVLFFFRSNLKQARLNSATFNQRIIDAYQGDVFGLESGSQVTKEQRNQFIRWWNVASASPTTFGDALGVMGYMAVYNRNIANGMSPKEALKVFNDYNETQQSRRGTEASPMQVYAKRQPLLRMMTMFSSTMLLQINKVYQSSTNVMRDISNKKVPSKRDIRSIYLNVGLANVLFVLAGNMMKLIDGDDEDKEEVYTEMKKAMYFMNQLKKIPVYGAAFAGIEAMVDGKRAFSSMQGPLDKLTYDVAKSIKDEKYWEFGKRVLDFGASTNFDMFQGIIQGTTEGFEDEVIYDTIGLPKSARPKGEKEKKEKKEKSRYQERPTKKYKERRYKERP